MATFILNRSLTQFLRDQWMPKLSDDDRQLKDFIRHMSVASFKEVTHLELKIEEIADFAHAACDWTALINLSGPQMKASFRVHFTTQTAQSLASCAFGNTPEEVTEPEAKDFMMELSNITSGRVKRALSLNEIMVGMSLPLVNKGLGSLDTESSAEWSLIDHWTLNTPKGSVVCTVRMESSEPFHLIDPDSLSEGTVEVSIP